MRKLGYLVVACALTTLNVVNADAPAGMETCYGIAKAGQNDCSSTDTTCDKSVIDGDPNYFLYVPTGLCNKIVGGMLSANGDMDMGMPQSGTMPSTTPGTVPQTTTTPAPTTPSTMPAPSTSTTPSSSSKSGTSSSKY